MRTATQLEDLFIKAGLMIVEKTIQEGFPHELHPVYLYALKPIVSHI